jgi:fused signal recognition particle receptor
MSGFLGRVFGGGDKPPDSPAEGAQPRTSWLQRLKSGLARSSNALSEGIAAILTKRKLDAAALDDLEDMLIRADFGPSTAASIVATLRSGRYDREIGDDEVKAVLAAEIAKALDPVAKPLDINAGNRPHVILVVGVNGTGKTTTIGKLAAKLRAEGKSVVLAAGDTFRAAAIEQLKIWGTRTGATVVAGQQGADAAGLAFDALTQAKQADADVLIVDTAGRLQNKDALMAELEKVIRVVRKVAPEAPHTTLLTLDATTGQNALQQVEIFGRRAGVTGLVMTKLDGTARGGILVAIATKHQLPVHFIGVGEGVDDLEPFSADDFARALVGL